MTDTPKKILTFPGGASARIRVGNSGDDAGRFAARLIAAQIDRCDGAARIAFATGDTPLPAYRELARMHREDARRFDKVQAFLLDEYVGLPVDHPRRFANALRATLLDAIGLPDANFHTFGAPDANDDLDRVATDYERHIANAGGLDLAILGIGGNGHIAFNEPGSDPAARTRAVTLSDDTRRANSRAFASVDEVPARAVTVGIGTLLDARAILLIALGAGKAEAIRLALCGPVTADVPASFLQRYRGELDVVLDREAAAGL
ncbi:glucosamine-6-phosphate deaminase [bacterium]|nr:glucosamine-6-phosphate deaminase [bacterium]